MKYYTDPFHFGKSVGESHSTTTGIEESHSTTGIEESHSTTTGIEESHSTTGIEESITSLEEQIKKLEELKQHNDTVFTEESLNSFITITKAKLQLKRALEEKEVDK